MIRKDLEKRLSDLESRLHKEDNQERMKKIMEILDLIQSKSISDEDARIRLDEFDLGRLMDEVPD
jgi:hypothetical protein